MLRRRSGKSLSHCGVHLFLLQRTPKIWSAISLLSVTNFFRGGEAFAKFATEVITKLFEGRGAEDPVCAWVRGRRRGVRDRYLGPRTYRWRPASIPCLASTGSEKSSPQPRLRSKARELLYPNTCRSPNQPTQVLPSTQSGNRCPLLIDYLTSAEEALLLLRTRGSGCGHQFPRYALAKHFDSDPAIERRMKSLRTRAQIQRGKPMNPPQRFWRFAATVGRRQRHAVSPNLTGQEQACISS